MTVRHVAKIVIDASKLAEILDFKDMVIWNYQFNSIDGRFNRLEMIVEHRDLPEVQDGDMIPTVIPSYQKTTGANGVVTEIKRVSPKKTVVKP